MCATTVKKQEIFRHAQIHNANRRLARGVRPGGLRRKQQLAHNLGDNLSSGGGTSVTNADTPDDDSGYPGCEGNTTCESIASDLEEAAKMGATALADAWGMVTGGDKDDDGGFAGLAGNLKNVLEDLHDKLAMSSGMGSGMGGGMAGPDMGTPREAGCGDDAACKRVEQKLLDAKEMGAKVLMDVWNAATSSDDFAGLPGNLKNALEDLHDQLAADLAMDSGMPPPAMPTPGTNANFLAAGEWTGARGTFFSDTYGISTYADNRAGVERQSLSSLPLTGTFAYAGALDEGWRTTGDNPYTDPHIKLTAEFGMEDNSIMAQTYDGNPATADVRWTSGAGDIWDDGSFAADRFDGTEFTDGVTGAFYTDGNDDTFAHGQVITSDLFGSFTTGAGVEVE